jgi:hypothetical protein
MSHRAKWLGAVIVAVAVAAAVWFWPRTVKQPGNAGSTGDSPGTSSATRSRSPAVAAGGRSAEEIERARQKRTEVQQQIRAARGSGGTAPTGTAAGGVPGERVLDKDYIRGRITDMLPLIKECYEMALRTDPNLAGRLVVSFDIAGEPGAGGVVERAEIVRKGGSDGGDVSHPILDECVQATIESISFAPPAGGGKVSVTYPFVFATEK